jgi:hypothetical protein
MQTLNVGAGRSDEEYQAAQEQQRADLRAQSRSDANYFFIAAGLAAIGTGLLPIQLNIFVTIGAVDLLRLYGGATGHLAAYGAAGAWAAILVGLGFAGQKGYRWAFLAGVALYAADIIALAVMFSVWSIGIHGFFVFKWFQGQKALKDLSEAPVSQ